MALLCATLAFQKQTKMLLDEEFERAKEAYEAQHPEIVVDSSAAGRMPATHVKNEATAHAQVKKDPGAGEHSNPMPTDFMPSVLEKGQPGVEARADGEEARRKRETEGGGAGCSPRHKVRPRSAGDTRSRAAGSASSDGDDFVAPKKARNVSWQNGGKRGGAAIPAKPEEVPENAHLASQLENGIAADVDVKSDGYPVRKKAPRIFYSSRTHSQLKQVVKELHVSGYHPEMTLLASRREYCAKPHVRNHQDRNEKCKELVQDSRCAFWHRHDEVASKVRLAKKIFDIEDLLQLGGECGGCAYYGAVELFKSAELILCPYNYIIDGVIRNAREIDIGNDIVIFDEAHNIEDHARESASFSRDVATFGKCAEEIDDLILKNLLPTRGTPLFLAYKQIQKLMKCCKMLAEKIDSSGKMVGNGNGKVVALFEPKEMLEIMDVAGLDKEGLKHFRNELHAIASSDDDDYPSKAERSRRRRASRSSTAGFDASRGEEEEEEEDPFDAGYGVGPSRRNGRGGQRGADSSRRKPGCAAVVLAEALLAILGYVIQEPESYKMALQREQSQWQNKTDLNWWCFNAAVPFEAIRKSARSLIVSSGTLAPLASFAGELNVPFEVAKSLPHVVNVQKQVLSVVVAQGPRNVAMNGSYRFTGSTAWQDSVGEAILSYSKVIPGGLLVFFPSYRLLRDCSNRWQTADTHLWEQLQAAKGLVVVETSGGNKDVFMKSIVEYKEAAEKPPGAIMMGVCRGKISEGIDFKDEQARGVIVVGVPYPNRFDPQLKGKMQWNDDQRMGGRTELMTSSDWYDMQAFRALNQAVGRCVRHKRDFGAIIFLDQRYKRPAMLQQLPSWVRASMKPGLRGTHDETVHALTSFFAKVEDTLPPL